ncbi:MAG: alanyl-tRNA editing protein [Clostridia bacterium]|nr:alanyl-tRNA editing protein [Clostridia bacterium]
MTKKIFNSDPYLKKFEATVTACEENKGKFDLTLDQTAFFPTGGGQPHDDGEIDGAVVFDVYEKDGEIYHTVDRPIEVGKKVVCEIDFEKRFMLMQNHSGEHILSGIVHRKHGYNNVGFHMGSDFITVDFDGPLTAEQIAEAEAETNAMIAQNLDILTYFPSAEELEKLNYRSKKELTGKVRMVEVPGADLCACCGTHVKKTGEIGLVKIVEFMKYKGGVRLSILCGNRALEDYNKKNADIYRISALLSKKPCEVADGVERLLAEITEKKYAYDQLWRKYVEEKTENLVPTENIIFLTEEGRDNNDLRTLALAAAKKGGASLIVSGEENGVTRYVLASEKNDIRPFKKSLCENFKGRGGGKAEVCQGSLTASPEEIAEFIKNKTL